MMRISDRFGTKPVRLHFQAKFSFTLFHAHANYPNRWKNGVFRVIVYTITGKTEQRRVALQSKNDVAPGTASFLLEIVKPIT